MHKENLETKLEGINLRVIKKTMKNIHGEIKKGEDGMGVLRPPH